MQDLFVGLSQIASIFGLAFFYFWPSIPAGLALGLSPLLVIVITSLSYSCGAMVVALLGGKLRDWLLKRLGKATTLNPDSFIGRIWGRFGIVGLGLMAPMTVGSQLGAALGVALDVSPWRTFIWLSIGGVVWSSLLTVLVMAGVLGAQQVIP